MRSRATWICALSAWSLAAAAVSAQSPDQPPPRVPTPDEEFVAGAAADALVEMELARVVAERATRPELREYARLAASEQARVYEELKALAAQKKYALPSELTPEQKGQLAAVSRLQGAAFDDAYAAAAAGSRDRALAAFDKVAGAWGDPDVKAWATRALPTIRQRLARARQLSGAVAATGR
jgi:putative membrane protein